MACEACWEHHSGPVVVAGCLHEVEDEQGVEKREEERFFALACTIHMRRVGTDRTHLLVDYGSLTTIHILTSHSSDQPEQWEYDHV